MNSEVLETLTGTVKSKAKLVNEDNLKSEKPSSYTATIKDINEVYSLFPGQVIYVGYYKGMGTVTVLVADKEIVRYLNLSDIQAIPGDNIKKGTLVGSANKMYGLQFEYASEWQGDSNMPIRLNRGQDVVTYFKQNPIDLLEGRYTPQYHIWPKESYKEPSETVPLNIEQIYEFNDFVVKMPDIVENKNDQPFSLLTVPDSMWEELTNGRGEE